MLHQRMHTLCASADQIIASSLDTGNMKRSLGQQHRVCPDLPTTMGFFQPVTSRGMFSTTIGSRNTAQIMFIPNLLADWI